MWPPAVSEETVQVDTPAFTGRLEQLAPRGPRPSVKVTLPVGAPAPGAVAETVAVKVTDCPNTEGLRSETTATVVLALLTCWATALEVEVLKLPSPLYVAVMECAATGRLAIVQ